MYTNMIFRFSQFITTILPILSIFLVGYKYPVDKQPFRPIFQPPNWVFPLIWTYVSLALGFITALSFEKKNYRCLNIGFYLLILAGLLSWLPVNYCQNYKFGFGILLATCFVAISYILILGFQNLTSAVFLLPLPFWLVIASCLNGVIYDRLEDR